MFKDTTIRNTMTWKQSFRRYKCECGTTVQDRTCVKNIHYKSMKHQNYLKTLRLENYNDNRPDNRTCGVESGSSPIP